MPVITEKELEQYKEGLKQLTSLTENSQREKAQHQQSVNELSNKLKRSKRTSVLLGILAFLGIGGMAYYASTLTKNMISMDEHQQTIATLEETVLQSENGQQGYSPENTLEGQEVFAVQVGAFEKKDLSLYSEHFVNFKQISDAPYNKYALGNFASFEEAKEFRQELVKLGLTDAFIGVYLNGERIRIEKVF